MLRLLIDTCVWLDIAKDYRHQPTLRALEQMIETGDVVLVLPRQTLDEFARNKERIIRDSGKSLSSTFRRVKEAVRQFGPAEGKANALASLDDVDHRITILGEAVNESVQRIEAIFAAAEITDTSEAVLVRAGRAELFDGAQSIYALALGEVLSGYAPELMEEVKWEFEYNEEPRLLSEIMEAENLLFRQVWYNRHWNLRTSIERGTHKLVTEEEWNEASPKRRNKITVDTVWSRALAAAKKTDEEVGVET